MGGAAVCSIFRESDCINFKTVFSAPIILALILYTWYGIWDLFISWSLATFHFYLYWVESE